MSMLAGYPELIERLEKDGRRHVLAAMYDALAATGRHAVDTFTTILARSPDPDVRRLAIDGITLGHGSPEADYYTIATLIVDHEPAVADAAYRYELRREFGELNDTLANSFEVLGSDLSATLAERLAMERTVSHVSNTLARFVDQLAPDWSNLNELLDYVVGQEAVAAQCVLEAETVHGAIAAIEQLLDQILLFMIDRRLLLNPTPAAVKLSS